MALDGELWRTGMVLCPADAPDDALSRVTLASIACPPGIAFVRLGAAWIWRCLDSPPQRWGVTSVGRSRLTTMPQEQYAGCDVRFRPGDLVSMGDVYVSTPARTLVDIARYEDERPESEIIDVLRRLLRVHERNGHHGDDIIIAVRTARHLPYKMRCPDRINRALT